MINVFLVFQKFRNQLYFQRDRLLKSLNEHLASDELLAGSVEGDVVKTLILR